VGFDGTGGCAPLAPWSYGFGGAGIASIEDVASKPIAERASKATAPGTDRAEGAGTQASQESQPFKLASKPSVQRTNGKKSKLPAGCSIL